MPKLVQVKFQPYGVAISDPHGEVLLFVTSTRLASEWLARFGYTWVLGSRGWWSL